MTKTAAQRVVTKIANNRADALLKLAYEAGVHNHAVLLGAEQKDAKALCKVASESFSRGVDISEQRKAALRSAIISALRK